MSQPNEYASYGWIISHDHVAPNPTESDAGTVGPSNIDPVFEKRLKARIDLDENFDDGDIADLNGTMTKFKMLDADGNLLDFDIDEIKVSQSIVAHARHVVLVADSSKLSRHAPVRFATMNDVDTFVTDRITDPRLAQICAEMGVRVIATDPA